jgi:alpha-tubulin suppressor-like RCC1 family protein
MITKLAGGVGHTCLLKANGSAWCWGDNSQGELGIGNTTDHTTPVQVMMTAPLGDLATGRYHSCAVASDGSRVYCWGQNGWGQLGTGNAGTPNTPTPVVMADNSYLQGVIGVAAGEVHSCAVKSDGTVWCWGTGSSGQLGTGTPNNNSQPPTQVTQLNNATQLAALDDTTCARASDTTVWCWGNNQSNIPVQVLVEPGGAAFTDVAEVAVGQSHTCARKTDGSVWCWGSNYLGQLGIGNFSASAANPVQALGPGAATQLRAGSDFTCAVRADNTLSCWGGTENGQLGTGMEGYYALVNSPIAVVSGGNAALGGVTLVGLGDTHACAVKSDGTLSCWGNNSAGQLGTGLAENTAMRTSPELVLDGQGSAWSGATAISAFQSQTCTVQSDASAWCWGRNDRGTLGNGNTIDQTHPAAVVTVPLGPEFSSVGAVGVGDTHVCAVQASGAVWCWGDYSYTGIPNGGNSLVPEQTPLVASTVQIAAGGDHTCILESGGISCWGYDQFGQLGDGTTNTSQTAVTVHAAGSTGSLSGATAVTVAFDHTCAVLQDGSALCWGQNQSSELGIGTSDATALLPTPVVTAPGGPPLTGVAIIASGQYHGCAAKVDGTVWCWGMNSDGQVGIPASMASVATQVSNLDSVTGLVAGSRHNCAYKSDGSVWCWGNNSLGQLGDGITTSRFTPAVVPNLTGVVQLAAGDGHTCARKSDGQVWCWGAFGRGQLGNGLTARSLFPAAVALSCP